MEAYQAVAIAVMIAMGYVVHSTLKLNAYRKNAGVERTMLNLRDLAVFRRPGEHDREEVKLVRTNWLACAALLFLFIAMLSVLPQDVIDNISAG